MADLSNIGGVGAKTETKLREAGIESVEELAEAKPEDIEDIGENKAQKIIRRAGQETITSKTASDLLDEYEKQDYISTGVDAIDGILDGGWEPETVGMVYGQSGTGKTQLLFSTMAEASSEGTVVYLMTEVQSKSIAERLKELSNHVDDLSNIHIYEAHDVDEQYESYEHIGREFDEIDLLVIDSFTAQFRMNEKFDGRENLGDRSAEMGRHLRKISKMGRVFQMPVVMTGQVYESPDMFGKDDELYGGQKMEHFVSYFVRMRYGDGNLRKASLENHAGIAEDEVQVRIEEEEIVGVSQ